MGERNDLVERKLMLSLADDKRKVERNYEHAQARIKQLRAQITRLQDREGRLRDVLEGAAQFIRDRDKGDPESHDGWSDPDLRDAYLAVFAALSTDETRR